MRSIVNWLHLFSARVLRRILALVVLMSFTTACFTLGEQDEEINPPTSGRPIAYHGAGYSVAEFHGIDSNLQATDCRECHGDDLMGGDSEVSCDTSGCHSNDWRSDCTYCHGGLDSLSGAPPRGIDGTSEPLFAAFGAHKMHLSADGHPAFACTECHREAEGIEDILTPGHVFDDTPGRAEIAFGGLSAGGNYLTATRTCQNIYCHGNGKRPGSVSATDEITCASCHPDQNSSENAWENSLRDEHEEHVDDGILCAHCHNQVVDEQANIRNGALHVNGISNWSIAPSLGITVDSQDRCSGRCHVGDDENHSDENWD